MKIILTCPIGLEDVVEKDLIEWGIKEEDIYLFPFGFRGRVFAEVKDYQEACNLAYFLHSINRVFIYLGVFEVKQSLEGLEQIKEVAFNLEDIENFLDISKTFAVRCSRRGKHEYHSPDVEKYAGAGIVERYISKYGKRPRVNLENPDILLRFDLHNENLVVGLDLVGYESLNKRGYRIYKHPAPIKGPIAYGMLRLIDWKFEESLVDPMCGGGTIPIEAALYGLNYPAGFLRKENFLFWKIFENVKLKDFQFRNVSLSLFGFDKFKKHVDGAKLNAEKAKVLNFINFDVVDVSDLSKKIFKVDVVLTNPPYGLRIANPLETEKVYNNFFKESKKILSEKGRIGFITSRDDLVHRYISKYGFNLVHKRSIYHGKLNVYFYILTL